MSNPARARLSQPHSTGSLPRRAGRAFAALAASALLAGPAAADWLVTAEGARVETRGPWQIKGKMVVFTLTNGTLSSLRVSQVDLEASREATAAATAPAAPASPPPPRKPVLVLTDADVGHVTRAPGPAAGGSSAEGEEASTLEVTTWSQVQDTTSLDVQILGTLRNNSPGLATDLSVMVRLFDTDQELIAETPAILTPSTLAAGASTNFRALFPGVATFATVTFEADGNLQSRTLAPPPPGGEGSR